MIPRLKLTYSKQNGRANSLFSHLMKSPLWQPSSHVSRMAPILGLARPSNWLHFWNWLPAAGCIEQVRWILPSNILSTIAYSIKDIYCIYLLTIAGFLLKLSHENWASVFEGNYVNKIFNSFLNTFEGTFIPASLWLKSINHKITTHALRQAHEPPVNIRQYYIWNLETVIIQFQIYI